MRTVRRTIAALLALAAAGAAWPHAYLSGSEPPANAVLEAAPTELRLRFSEPAEREFVQLSVERDGKPLLGPAKAEVAADGRSARLAVTSLAPGAYVVRWKVLAKDGHRTEGRWSFTLRAR